MNLPGHDEIHVVSDLHMGGLPGFQILRETRRLAGFIRWVATQRPEGEVALVLNGDVIDTLAEESGGYVAVDNAVAIVERITRSDPAFSPVWDALAEFVRCERRKLVIVLGNHDIEIAFPVVQRALLERLAGADPLARSRIEFSTVGAGYACRVGAARVFCSHGNEVDPWNFIRYEDLSRVARRLNAGRSLAPAEWEPNAGTKMVKDVMNEVKRRYAWIDLLKPEAQAAVGVLAVLDPHQVTKLKDALPIIGERIKGGAQADRRLSADGLARPEAASRAADRSIDSLLGASLRRELGRSAGTSADEMLRSAEKAFRDHEATEGGDGTLGMIQYGLDRLTGKPKEEALRRALCDWLANDRTFDLDQRDDTFTAMSRSVGDRIDFLITGHTHLERAIEMGGGRYYFNCGTWIRLLRLTDGMLKDLAAFAPVYRVLTDGTMAAIDAARFGDESFVLDRTSAVTIRAEGERVVGELAHIGGGDLPSRTIVKQFSRG